MVECCNKYCWKNYLHNAKETVAKAKGLKILASKEIYLKPK